MKPEIFQYKKLTDDRTKFRLLKLQNDPYGDIKCGLIEADMGASGRMPYVAVSHRWDTASGGRYISLDTTELNFHVSNGLFSMLDALRSAEHRHLWLDQLIWIDMICIDQSCKKEKACQLKLMKEIYANADNVIIWLGRGTQYTDIVMRALAAFQTKKEELYQSLSVKEPQAYSEIAWENARMTALPEVNSDEVSQSFDTLLSHSWFRRAWVLQEVGNARRAWVLCGNKSISTQIFAVAPRIAGVTPSPHCQEVLDLMPSSIRKMPDFADLYGVLRRFRSTEATEAKDRIFALLGLCSGTVSDSISRHYKASIRDIIRAVAAHICFCDERFLPEQCYNYKTIDAFLSDLEGLYTRFFKHLILTSDWPSIRDFFVKSKQHIKISGTMLQALVQRHSEGLVQCQSGSTDPKDNDDNLMDLIFDHLETHFVITEQTLFSIVTNKIQGRVLMRALVAHCRDQIQITEEVISALAENTSTGLDILKEIPRRPDEELKISGSKTITLWRDRPQGQEIIRLIYQMFQVQLEFETNEIVKIKNNRSQYEHLLALLAARTPDVSGVNLSFDRPDESLKEAIEAGYVGFVSSLEEIHKGDKERRKNRWKDVAHKLFQAILDKDTTAVDALALEYKVPGLRDRVERLPSLLAAEEGNTALISKLLEDGAFLEYQDEWGESLLAIVSRKGYDAATICLCEKGALIDSRSIFGWTPLHLAAAHGHASIVDILVRFGADVDARDMFGGTPLMKAAVGAKTA